MSGSSPLFYFFPRNLFCFLFLSSPLKILATKGYQPRRFDCSALPVVIIVTTDGITVAAKETWTVATETATGTATVLVTAVTTGTTGTETESIIVFRLTRS
jgi:hypothetical protein